MEATPPRTEAARGGTGGLRAEPGPGPDETAALAWEAIDEASQRRWRPGVRALDGFLRGLAPHVTPQGDARTNIVDQGGRVTYCLGPGEQARLLGHLEACRLEKTATHFSERQGTLAAPCSGLMLDFDLVVSTQKPSLPDRLCHRLACTVAAALQEDVELPEGPLHVFFLARAEASLIAAPPGGRYRYGLHVLVPGLRLPRPYKRWLVRRLRASAALAATMRELGAESPEESLDANSASVPALFFGSCKRGGTPYGLAAAFEVTPDAWGPPSARLLAEAELTGGAAPYNLAAELALNCEASYADGRPPLVRKRDAAPRAAAAAAAQDWGERSAGGEAGATPPEELADAEHALSTLTLHDAEARHLHALLDLLGPEYSADRNRWRDVVYALANSSESYKPLAVWFSHRCPLKWREGGAEALDQLWAEAAARRGAPERPLTLRSIAHWARTAAPARYAEVMERSYFAILVGYVYESGGRLQHYMFAKVLRAMLGDKFAVDVEAGARGPTYCWYEFVLPGQPMRPGEVWKWRREAEPDDVHVYMSERLTAVLERVAEHLEEKRQGAAEEAQARYYKDLAKAFAGSRNSLYNDTFKNGVVRQACYLFRRRNFAASLDRSPLHFGTFNGVLALGARCALIDHYHEHPVSKFSPVAWRPFDPADPWVRLVLDALAAVVPEPDARDWILYHAAQGLSGGPKEGVMLLWEGGGQNGKTSFLRWVAKALGPYAAKFNIQLMCCEREDADRPNSAMMRFEHLNYAYAEEANKAQALNVARMKEMVNAGEVSGRDLHSRQREFTMRANLVAASQYTFIVSTTDHGTWRRIRHYTSKTRFRQAPDPSNPFERPDDQRYVRSYPDDPQFQSAVLAILTHYYERLQVEHGGELKNVSSPTIDQETEAFRVSQDALHRWICETVVLSPESPTEYHASALSGAYLAWYAAHVDSLKKQSRGEVIKDLEASALGKHLRPAPNQALFLRGCRLLTAEEPHIRPGETFFGACRRAGPPSAVGPGPAAWWAAPPARPPPAATAPDGADLALLRAAGAALEGAQSGAAAAQSAAAAAPPADSDNALSDDDLTLLLWPEAPEGGRGLSDGDVYE